MKSREKNRTFAEIFCVLVDMVLLMNFCSGIQTYCCVACPGAILAG